MDKKSKLKELLFKMMKVEIKKMDVENDLKINIAYYGEKRANDAYAYNMKQLDKEGYTLGLIFQEIKKELADNGDLSVNNEIDYFNATRIAATNFLLKYGLEYPQYWEYNNTVQYHSEDVILEDHKKFVTKVEEMFANGLISAIQRSRILDASEYFLASAKIGIRGKNISNEQRTK